MSSEGTCACCGTESPASDEGSVTCYCPLDGVLDAVAKKYSLRIVAVLGANGPTRFTELERRLGATSSSTLSDQLTELVAAGLVERRSFDEVPPRVEYSLTPRGRELEDRLRPLLDWAAERE